MSFCSRRWRGLTFITGVGSGGIAAMTLKR